MFATTTTIAQTGHARAVGAVAEDAIAARFRPRLRDVAKRVAFPLSLVLFKTLRRRVNEDIAAVEAPEIEVNNAAGLFARGTRPHREKRRSPRRARRPLGWRSASG